MFYTSSTWLRGNSAASLFFLPCRVFCSHKAPHSNNRSVKVWSVFFIFREDKEFEGMGKEVPITVL